MLICACTKGDTNVCNTLIKIYSAIILVVAIVLNFFGNLFGIGDIIPTQPKTTEGTSISETYTETEETTTGRDLTVEDSSAETSEATSALPSTEPSTEITTKPVQITTLPQTTKEFGQKVSSATQLSAASFGGSDTDTFTGIAKGTNGSFVVCGVSVSTDSDLLNVPDDSWSENYGFVAKYGKSSLAPEWIKSVGSAYDGVRIEDVAVLKDGGIVAVGYTAAQDFASDPEFSGTIESFIVRYSADGAVVWKKLFGGKGSDMFMNVESLGDGFVVGGKTESSDGDFSDAPQTSVSKAVLISFSSDGNVLWKKYLSGNYASSVDGVATDSDGNIFITSVTGAYTGDYALVDGIGKGYLDTAVIKYSSSGEMLWAKSVSGSGRENFGAVAADGKGGCVVAGYYELTTNTVPDGTLAGVHNCGDTDAVAIRFNSDGSTRWIRSIGGISGEVINDIAATENGYAVVGYTSSANRDFASMGNKGATDSFVALITPEGNLAQVQGRGGARKDMATCAVFTTDGRLIVLGRTTSSDGDFSGMNSHLSDVLLGILGDIFTGYITKYKVTVSW